MIERLLGKEKLFSVLAILGIALGLGSSITVFAAISETLLKPLPYRDPDRLVQIGQYFAPEDTPTGAAFSTFDIQASFVEEWRARSRTLVQIAAFFDFERTLEGAGGSVRVAARSLSPEMFEMLGVGSAIGRVFAQDEARPGADDVAVISDALWAREFGREPGVVGTEILLDGRQYTVVGVLLPSQELPGGYTDVLLPYVPTTIIGTTTVDSTPEVIGRLDVGASIADAARELTAIVSTAGQAQSAFGLSAEGRQIEVFRLNDLRVSPRDQAVLTVAQLITLVITLMASANVGSLLLLRTEARRNELAIKVALGASRYHLLRPTFAESALLVGIGGALGGIGSHIVLKAAAFVLPDFAVTSGVRLDTPTLAFTLSLMAMAVLCAVSSPLYVIAKGKHSRIMQQLRNEPAVSHIGASNTIRNGIVFTELFLSTILVLGAVSLITAFWQLSRIDIGVRVGNVLTFGVSVPVGRYADDREFVDRFLRELRSLPGIAAAGATNAVPLSGRSETRPLLSVQGLAEPTSFADTPALRVVTPGYFEAAGIAVVDGGVFVDDGAGVVRPLVVNEMLVRRFMQGKSPVGRGITFEDLGEVWTIIGVVGDVRHYGPDREAVPEIYMPLSQRLRYAQPGNMYYVVRTAGPPMDHVLTIRSVLSHVDPEAVMELNVATLSGLRNAFIARPREYAALGVLLGSVAVALATSGVFSVMAYAVSRRTPEIGLRLALGAMPRDMPWLMLRETLHWPAIGILGGLAVGGALSNLLQNMLYGVSTFRLASYLIAAMVLSVLAGATAYVPAARAARVDPLVAMRRE